MFIDDKDGQRKEDTQWHRVILWGKTAEALQDYLTKGKQIYVESAGVRAGDVDQRAQRG